MFRRAFLQQLGHDRLRVEERLVFEDCARRGIPTEFYLAKHIQRRQLPIDRECFICGDMDAMHGAMKILGIEPPTTDDFPTVLEPYLHRRIWRSSIPQLEDALLSGREIFAKPAGRRKHFTGRVFSSPDDLRHIYGISRQEPLWCSDVVTWTSEYRVYVVDHHLRAVAHYDGDERVTLDMDVVHSAISLYATVAPAAYGIDFGVLATGQTALVEANDGYALGAYQVDSESYAALLYTRWNQLLKTTPPPH